MPAINPSETIKLSENKLLQSRTCLVYCTQLVFSK
jgi:hypothetical protein